MLTKWPRTNKMSLARWSADDSSFKTVNYNKQVLLYFATDLKNNENQNGRLSIRSRNRKNKQSLKLKTNVILRENFGATSFCQLAIFSNHKKYLKQGTLTEGEGSVQLTSL
jgi:hypothetical protein